MAEGVVEIARDGFLISGTKRPPPTLHTLTVAISTPLATQSYYYNKNISKLAGACRVSKLSRNLMLKYLFHPLKGMTSE